jgi:prepilin-type N-terminal cleavage/methylation domain-containing protein
MTLPGDRNPRTIPVQNKGSETPRGFTLIELLVAMTIMTIGLLAISAMFSTGYTDVTMAGRTTMVIAEARQILDDMHAIPFDRLDSLDCGGAGFNTNAPACPAGPDGSESAAVQKEKTMVRNFARKWRHVLAGPGGGWETYTSAEQKAWPTMSASGVSPGAVPTANATIRVTNVNPPPDTTLKRITVTVTLPGRASTQLITFISRL